MNTTRRRFLQTAASAIAAGYAAPITFADAVGDSKELIVHSKQPMNAEPSLDNLTRSWLTPLKHFYVRSHAPNPAIAATSHQLRIEGLVEKPLTLGLAELNGRFESHSAIATMTCAGNRRNEHNAVKPVGGVQWLAGAIGNAEWGGVRLSDVLKAAGIKPEAKHVWFDSLDRIEKDGKTFPFGASIPIAKAMTDAPDMPGALLASQMNRQPLSADHGFPLRTVVPGYIGARSVKWLGKIVVSDRPSPNHYVATAYKLVTESTPEQWAKAEPLYAYRQNSAIASPSAKAMLTAGRVNVSGYALPPGDGGTIEKVEVSADGGKTWTVAKLNTTSRAYCWVLWSAAVNVAAGTKQLISRATDSQGRTQPQTVPWNLKGYMMNSWYRLPVVT